MVTEVTRDVGLEEGGQDLALDRVHAPNVLGSLSLKMMLTWM